MGSGKSSVGRLLAKRLRFRFVDTDRMIVQHTGKEITAIFAEHGEPFFREHEQRALRALRDWRGLVIATGGGIVTRQENVALLREIAFVVWLTASDEVIFERVSRNTRRPLLHTENPRETIATLFAQRRPLYEKAANFVVDTSTRSHAEIADMVITEAQRFSVGQASSSS
jgi:shikimate kinase